MTDEELTRELDALHVRQTDLNGAFHRNLTEQLCRAVERLFPEATSAVFLVDEWDNGYFFQKSPYSVSMPGEVLHPGDEPVGDALMTHVSLHFAPIGRETALRVALKSRQMEVRP